MAGVPQIEVTFTLDANGIVNVSARDLKTGKVQEITIEASSNLNEAELQAAIHNAEQYAAEDAQFRKEREDREKLQVLIIKAEELEREAAKNKNKEKLKKIQTECKEPLKQAKKALNGKDSNAVIPASVELERSIENIEQV
jgi:molecular chaperone DnaK